MKKFQSSVILFQLISLFACLFSFSIHAQSIDTFEASKIDRGSLRAVITPRDDIRLSTQVEGIIKEYYKQEGDRVHANEPILRLDDRIEQAELDRIAANIVAADAEFKKASNDYNRIQTLHSEKIASDKQLDEATFQLENAKSHQQQAKATYQLAKIQLDYRTIRSPIEGVFLKKNKSPGESVTRLEVVARVIDDSGLQMVLYCGPQLLNRLHTDQSVNVKLLDGPSKGQIVQASVEYVDSMIDASTGTFRVRLSIPYSENIHPGLAGLLLLEPTNS